jgi:glycerophosphoryl diester phosphodiesterase
LSRLSASAPGAPFVVAHRAGNDLASLARAHALGLVVVEADLRLFRGRVEVRHLKTVGPLPIFWDRWRLASPFGGRLVLLDLLRAVRPPTTLMLDLKGRDDRLSRLVVAALADAPPPHAPRPRLFLCARRWSLLEPFRGLPGVRTIHSVGTTRQLRRLLASDDRVDGVSIHRRLLDAATVAALRRRADLVLTWPVNGLAAARQLGSWGVDGLISDEPGLVLDGLAQAAA